MSEILQRVANAIAAADGDYYGMARAAIEAMREPTGAQTILMNKLLGADTPPTRRWHWVWQEMIDEALRESKPVIDEALR